MGIRKPGASAGSMRVSVVAALEGSRRDAGTGCDGAAPAYQGERPRQACWSCSSLQPNKKLAFSMGVGNPHSGPGVCMAGRPIPDLCVTVKVGGVFPL